MQLKQLLATAAKTHSNLYKVYDELDEPTCNGERFFEIQGSVQKTSQGKTPKKVVQRKVKKTKKTHDKSKRKARKNSTATKKVDKLFGINIPRRRAVCVAQATLYNS